MRRQLTTQGTTTLFNHGHLSQNQNNKHNITIHTQTIYSLEISLIIYIEYTDQYEYHVYSEKPQKLHNQIYWHN